MASRRMQKNLTKSISWAAMKPTNANKRMKKWNLLGGSSRSFHRHNYKQKKFWLKFPAEGNSDIEVRLIAVVPRPSTFTVRSRRL